MTRTKLALLTVAPPSVVALAVASAASGCNQSAPAYDPRARARGGRGPRPDYGAVVTQAVPPPPISGGTLLAGRKGGLTLVADPDRSRLHVVDVRRGLSREIVLPDSDEPGRAVLDGAGRAHVAMRASGDLVTVDLASASIVLRRSACIAARGVAYDAAHDAVVIACAEGALGVFPAGGGPATKRIATERDVRDLWIAGDTVFVSLFRTATIHSYTTAGEWLRARPMNGANVAWRMTSFSMPKDEAAPAEDEDAGAPEEAPPSCAAPADGGASDGGASDDVDCAEPPASTDPEPPVLPPDVPIVVDQVPTDPRPGASPIGYYAGGGAPCTASSVVSARVDLLGAGSVSIPDAVLPVDVATNGRHVAVAAAGNGHTPSLAQLFVFDARGLVPLRMPLDAGTTGSLGGGGGYYGGAGPCDDIVRVSLPGQVVATAFDGDGRLLVQSREPAALYVMSPDYRTVRRTIPLSAESREDTGHAIFHSNSGGFIACASCHPEGGEDARVWTFDVGKRRTPSLRGTVANTEPFHWSGDLPDLHALVAHTFVERMSGPTLDGPQEATLKSWLFAIPAPKPPTAASEAARRGASVFEAAGCARCHGGAMLTNNLTTDVGTGGMLQVPSLRGVGWRAPFLHDGCARTMADRFSPACGDQLHGNVGSLPVQQRSDLAAFLDTL